MKPFIIYSQLGAKIMDLGCSFKIHLLQRKRLTPFLTFKASKPNQFYTTGV
jgi:hypothetical protein